MREAFARLGGEVEEEGFPRGGAGGCLYVVAHHLGWLVRIDRFDFINNRGEQKIFCFFFLVSGELYLRVLQRPTADLEEVDAGLDEELDLAHRVLKVGGVVVRRVQLDADAEVGAHGLARLRDDVQDELGALFGGAAVGVCAAVGLDVALETVTLL